MTKKIFLITGGIDIQKSGNQTIKNTIYYLSKFNFSVRIFNFLPKNYPNILSSQEAFGNLSQKIKFHRLPSVFYYCFKIAKFLKNKFGGKKKGNINKYSNLWKQKDYFSDSNQFAQLIYFACWILYFILEFHRVFIWSIKEKPDLFYGYEIYGAPLASFLGKLFRKPVITRFQGTALRINEEKKWLKMYPHHVFGLKSTSDAVIMCNDGTRGQEILLKIKVPKKKIYFWNNGLDLNFTIDPITIHEIKNKLHLENKKVLITVSKLKIWKRVDRAIFALYKLKTDYNLINTVLLIIGDGHDKAHLIKLAKKYDILESVKFLGEIPHKEVGIYFSLADIFLILQDVSNLSNQLLEALYFGLPIVSLNEKSTENLLMHNYNAMLVAPKQIKNGVAKEIYKILNDEELATKLRQNAKLTAKEKILTWEQRMNKEIQLINKLLPYRLKK